jgi:O-antigen ligase
VAQTILRALLWFDLPLAALAASAVVALGVAWETDSAQQAVLWLGAGILVSVILSRLCQRENVWRAAARVLVLGGAGLGLYVVLQYPYLGYDVKVASLARIGGAIGKLVPRIGAWAPMPNSVATLLEGLVPLAAALALERGRAGWRLIAGVSALLMLLAIVLVASRGAWVALFAACLAWALAWGWTRRASLFGKLAVVASVAAALLLVAVATGLVAPSIAGFQLGSVFDRPDRLNVYRNSLVLIRDFPFTGIGPGNQFAMALSRYALLIQVPVLTYAHNLYLNLWLELGLAGILSWVLLVGAVLAAILVGERAVLGISFRGAWSGILVVLVHGLTDARQFVDRWTWLPFFVLLGLLAATLRRERPRVTFGAAAVPVAAVLAFLAAALVSLRRLRRRGRRIWECWRKPRAWRCPEGALRRSPGGSTSAGRRGRSGQPTSRRRLGLLRSMRGDSRRRGRTCNSRGSRTAATPPRGRPTGWRARGTGTSSPRAIFSGRSKGLSMS